MSLTRPIDKWTDPELEDEVNRLEWTIEFFQNLAFAVHDHTDGEAIQASVHHQRDWLTKLRNERDYRITQGSYRPFHRAMR